MIQAHTVQTKRGTSWHHRTQSKTAQKKANMPPHNLPPHLRFRIDSFFFKKKAGVPKKIKLCPTISLDPLC
jgi:hypothetical protein